MTMRSRRRRLGGMNETDIKGSDACAKEMKKRFETKDHWNNLKKDPRAGILSKSRAYASKWSSKWKLARCLSRFNHRRNFENRRQESFLAKVRPSLLEKTSKSVESMTKAMTTLERFISHAEHKLAQISDKDVKFMLEEGKQMLRNGNSMLLDLDERMNDNAPQVNDLVKQMTAAMKRYVQSNGEVLVRSTGVGGARARATRRPRWQSRRKLSNH